MPDRRLVVSDIDPTSADYGKLFGLDVGMATGVPIPAFRFGPAKPATGSERGEAFYELNTQKGWVWDGTAWREIAASPITSFATEVLLKADAVQPVGSYAVAADTGQLFLRRPGGWVVVGVQQYTTAAALLADAAAPGTLAEALDENTLWQRTAAGWRLLVVREMADTAAIVAWKNADPGAAVGDRVEDVAHGVSYVRIGTGWKPVTLWEDTEANIRAATWCVSGQEAIATDTGRVFTFTGGRWVEEPIEHFATEAALLATAPQPGVLAWADDTNVVFLRVAGTPAGPGGVPPAGAARWKRLQGPQIAYGPTAPATPGAGDLFLDSDGNSGALELYSGSAWVAATPGAVAVGSIQQSMLDPTQFAAATGRDSANWVLADGRAVPGTKYAVITGQANVPDLRGMFIRGAGTSASGWVGGAVGSGHQDTTRLPRAAAFTGTTSDPGNHHHTETASPFRGGDSGHFTWEGATPAGSARTTSDAGAHTHTVTINGGGDTETAPVHISLNTYIRVN